MRLTTIIALAVVGLAVVMPAASFGAEEATLGTGAKTCTAKHHASCPGITHHRSNLAGQNLRGARFHGSKMHHTDFRQANLRGAHFQRAELHHSDFRRADLRGAHFEGAKLHGVDFRDA